MKALPHLAPVPCETQQQLLRERIRKSMSYVELSGVFWFWNLRDLEALYNC